MTLRISINTIPHHSHRYCTVGDYQDAPNGDRAIQVSEMNNSDYEFLVAIHEAIEQHLCLTRGVSEALITSFDKAYELKRLPGDHSEPGDSSDAPYRKEHEFATMRSTLVANSCSL